MIENVDHPFHYNFGTIEAIEVIEDWNLGFNLGNAVKYIARCDHKGSSIEDLEKASWYLQREIELRKKRSGDNCYESVTKVLQKERKVSELS